MCKMMSDVIPEGTFNAESEQVAAILMVERKGLWLVENHPEIASRVDETYKSIASNIF